MSTSTNVLELSSKQAERIKKLEDLYLQKTGNKIKVMSDQPYEVIEQMLEMYLGHNVTQQMTVPAVGQVVTGKIVGQMNNWLILDGSFKDNIYIEVSGFEETVLKERNIQTGDSLEVMITAVNLENFEIRGSVAQLLKSNMDKMLQQALIDNDCAFYAQIKELTPAGYYVDILFENLKIPAFMPNTLAGINKLHDPKSILNQVLEIMIENHTKDGYVVSRKKYLQNMIKDSIKTLEYGKSYTGHITGTTDFGVFVEFEKCLTGMIHKDNLDEQSLKNLTNLQAGQEISFFIKEIFKEKIILTQVIRPSLWDNLEVGQKISGTVKSSKSFGTLIQLDVETVGLVPTSELERLGYDKLNEGTKVQVKVVEVRRSERKISLSLEKLMKN